MEDDIQNILYIFDSNSYKLMENFKATEKTLSILIEILSCDRQYG